MNILFITHNDNFYGSSKSLLSLLLGLKSFDVNPFVVVSRESGFTVALAENNIPYKILPVEWWMTRRPISWVGKLRLINNLLSSIPLFLRLLRQWKIELVYTNSSVSPIGRIISFLKHIPHVWHFREFGDLDFSLNYIFNKRLCFKIINSSSAIICNSKAVRDHLFASDTGNLSLVYNGSATKEQFDFLLSQRKKKLKKSGGFTFSLVSSITSKKGQETAIRAVSVLQKQGLKVRLLIAGHGKDVYVNYCKSLVEDLGIIGNVEFKGFVDDPYQIYFESDCILVCSEHEALSRVALEAMSCGVPVIARNSGGSPEIIDSGKTGLLYDNFEDLCESMIKVMENRAWGEELGLAGWQIAKEKLNIENYANNVHTIIKNILQE